MSKKYIPIMEIQNHRIVKTPKGTYRLQYRVRRTFLECILRKSPWRTICIDFDHGYRVRAKLYRYYEERPIHYTYKDRL